MSPPACASPVHAAVMFDGRSAAAVPVQVVIGEGRLHVRTPEGAPVLEARLAEVVLSDAFASAPRQITFPGGALVEVADGATLTAALAASGRGPGMVVRLEQRWVAATLSLVASVALLAAGYVEGLPRVVRAIALRLPEHAEQQLGESVLAVLDGGLLRPSTLGEVERAEAEGRIAEIIAAGAPVGRHRLAFRTMGHGLDVNAFAIPGGTVVLLDGLVRRAQGRDLLAAVVGHELGHQVRRHSTQALLQAAGIGAAASLLWGDFSGQAATLPAILAMTRYSREAEREADDDALQFLRAAGLGAATMLDALCLLADVERESGRGGIPQVLSSHPDIEERIARVRALAGLGGHGCAAAAGP